MEASIERGREGEAWLEMERDAGGMGEVSEKCMGMKDILPLDHALKYAYEYQIMNMWHDDRLLACTMIDY